MSRAFVKEDNSEQAGSELIERPLSPHTNYVTPTGLRQLQAEAARLENLRARLAQNKDDPFAMQQRAETERDLRYYSARLENAELVQPPRQPSNEVRFGAIVSMEDEDGELHEFAIVGEDEADIAASKVSWVSPLAKALIGAHVGDVVKWRRPAGDRQLEITGIRYDTASL
jgi:transcription elongation GreA/GreB family factor